MKINNNICRINTYPVNSNINKFNINKETSFGNANKPLPSKLDKFLKNKFVQGLFKLADKNPFAFNIVALATTCMLMRPVTILAIPGTNEKDKKYAAGKSFIASVIGNSSRLLFILPLGIFMANLGRQAVKNPKLKFPKDKTPEFQAYNYLVNNLAATLLAIPTSGLMVYAVAKVMDKFTHQKSRVKMNNVSYRGEINGKN